MNSVKTSSTEYWKSSPARVGGRRGLVRDARRARPPARGEVERICSPESTPRPSAARPRLGTWSASRTRPAPPCPTRAPPAGPAAPAARAWPGRQSSRSRGSPAPLRTAPGRGRRRLLALRRHRVVRAAFLRRGRSTAARGRSVETSPRRRPNRLRRPRAALVHDDAASGPGLVSSSCGRRVGDGRALEGAPRTRPVHPVTLHRLGGDDLLRFGRAPPRTRARLRARRHLHPVVFGQRGSKLAPRPRPRHPVPGVGFDGHSPRPPARWLGDDDVIVGVIRELVAAPARRRPARLRGVLVRAPRPHPLRRPAARSPPAPRAHPPAPRRRRFRPRPVRDDGLLVGVLTGAGPPGEARRGTPASRGAAGCRFSSVSR